LGAENRGAERKGIRGRAGERKKGEFVRLGKNGIELRKEGRNEN